MRGTYYSQYKLAHHIDALEADRPPYAMWDFTNYCNQSCKRCVSKYKGQYTAEYTAGNQWDNALIPDVAQQLQALGVKAIHLTGGGEPLVYPDFAWAAELLLHMGFELSMATNGALLEQYDPALAARFTWIRVSLDAIRDDTYKTLRGVDYTLWDMLDSVIPRIKKHGDVTLGTSFVVQQENVREMHNHAVWAKSRGFHNTRFTYGWSPNGLTINAPVIGKALEQIERIEESQLSDDRFTVLTFVERMFPKSHNFSHCYYADAAVIIAANGCVYRCCAYKNTTQGLLGSLYEESLANIWTNRGDQDVRLCPMCYASIRNEFVEYLMCENPKHVNFV